MLTTLFDFSLFYHVENFQHSNCWLVCLDLIYEIFYETHCITYIWLELQVKNLMQFEEKIERLEKVTSNWKLKGFLRRYIHEINFFFKDYCMLYYRNCLIFDFNAVIFNVTFRWTTGNHNWITFKRLCHFFWWRIRLGYIEIRINIYCSRY